MTSKHQHLSWKLKKFNKILIEWLWLFYNETPEKKKITFVHYCNRQKLSVPIFIKKKKRTETNIPIFLDVK